MALTRRSGQRFHASVWPGFVDALSTLLLVLIFVLTIFMVVESVQIETISGQENQLDRLSQQVDRLAHALGSEQQKNDALGSQVEGLNRDIATARENADAQSQLIDRLTADVATRDSALAKARDDLASYEEQVASLLADRDTARAEAADLHGKVADLESARDALDTALAKARQEIDANAEAARLAAARREALDALVADLRNKAAEQDDTLASTQAALNSAQAALSKEEADRVAEAEAAKLLREKLKNADAELTAMTLTLEEKRKEAETTLTLLAAAQERADQIDERLMAALLDGKASPQAMAAAQQALDAARKRIAADGATPEDLRQRLADAVAAKVSTETEAVMSESERQARLLATARKELSDAQAASAEDQRRLALLNQQVAGLQAQLGSLQAVLDASEARDAAAQVQIENLGQRLNTALARAASEERKRAELEAERAKQLEADAKRLETYRSEFFGRLREVLGNREGVRIEGDRFVFSSEVLFASGSAELSPAGEASIANVARTLEEVAALIPPGINWIIRVDGHTDDIPVSPGSPYKDNWELSQARALSVVRYMIDNFGFPPDRLAATGFGEFQPVDPADTPEARARNRRIELKLTER
ncbi:MAG: peptidoglycan -binding protein [Rhodobacteraceae bacterium]|nr:peptidoglycan -binding protein [Paracoccaceae bacterium]